jgi:hypothetical protein
MIFATAPQTQPSASASELVVGGVLKVVTPDERKLNDFYPERAQRLGISGQSVLLCKVNAAHKLELCKTNAEKPEGYSFSEAGLRVAQILAIDPSELTIAGDYVVVAVSFKVRYALDNDYKVRMTVYSTQTAPAP